MSKIYKKTPNVKAIGDDQKYLSRITKTLYYGKYPKIDTLSLPLTELAVEIFSETQKGKSLERLHFNDASNISRKACVSPCSLVLAMLYFERLKKHTPEYLEKTRPSDLFLVSLMVSSKFLFDDGESDEVFIDEWADSGSITIKELAQLERDFLTAIDWELYVNKLSFWKKLTEIETTIAKREGTQRGFFTYTELLNLTSIIELQNVVQCVFAVSVILAATYTAGLLTLVGSVFLASHVPGTSLYPKKIDNHQNTTLPIMHNIEINNISSINLNTTENNNFECNNYWSLDVVDVLKTSILLASIKSKMSFCDGRNNSHLEKIDNNDCQFISWDWWNTPVMNWLTKSSEYISSFEMPIKYFPYHLESNAKYIDLEDHIHKATKTRIQDQLESSWHKEWTDTIRYNIFYSNRLVPYIENIKS